MSTDITGQAPANIHDVAADTTIPYTEIREVRLPGGQTVRDLRMNTERAKLERAIDERDMILRVMAGYVRVELDGVDVGVLHPGNILWIPGGTQFSYRPEAAPSTIDVSLAALLCYDVPEATHLMETYMPPRV